MRSATVRKSALQHQTWCSRCAHQTNLVVHHKFPLADGGTDTLENTDVLCNGCHWEWHKIAEGRVEYDDFLDSPRAVEFFMAATDDKFLDTTIGDFLVAIQEARFERAWKVAGAILRTRQMVPECSHAKLWRPQSERL